MSEYKPFLLFLGKFFLSYLVLTIAYKSYLSEFDESKYEVDGFTTAVASQSASILSWFDSQSFVMPNLKESCVNLYYHNAWVARIVEGCNAISVVILFVSFVVAFSGKFKQTVFFTSAGIALIYFFNILRIVLLSMAIYHYPQFKDVLHNVVFPLFIYGIVFLLWIIWVNKFSYYAKKYTKK